jgi:hypothetical protein
VLNRLPGVFDTENDDAISAVERAAFSDARFGEAEAPAPHARTKKELDDTRRKRSGMIRPFCSMKR